MGEAKLDKLTLNLQALRSMGPFFLQEVFFRSDDAALTLSFPFLETIDGSFMFGASLNALTLTCPSVSKIKEFFLTSSKIRTLTLNTPRLTCAKESWLRHCPHQTTFNMQDLSAVMKKNTPQINHRIGPLMNTAHVFSLKSEWESLDSKLWSPYLDLQPRNALSQNRSSTGDIPEGNATTDPIVHSYNNPETGHLSNRSLSFPLPFGNGWKTPFLEKEPPLSIVHT